jgi:TnsA endonuclease N terminal
MINSAPKQPGKYKQGLYVPKNKEKLIKANSYGGVFYRSGLEQKMMIYLDSNENIKSWGAEHLRIPYEKTEYNNTTHELETTVHSYFPDFYYELQRSDGTISRVVAEVKPSNETVEPKLPQDATAKQLKNFEYALKMWNKNLSKWKYMIEYCQRKGFEFIIITEQHLSKK